MGSLQTWLQLRNEGNILNKTVAHVMKVLETVVEFERGFNLLLKEHNYKLAIEVFQRVSQLEHEADIIRRDILHQISMGEMLPQMREDLVNLIKQIDQIANTVNGASRIIINLSQDTLKTLGEPILGKMLEIIHFSVESAKILTTLVKKLPELDQKGVFSYTEQVQLIEHKCDLIYAEICRLLNQVPSVNFNPFVAIEISKFTNLLEEITDVIEDVGDYIEMIKAK
jgi:predicted phosphate transport protein (TIGR00153 family)